jgi:hypothetical protein
MEYLESDGFFSSYKENVSLFLGGPKIQEPKSKFRKKMKDFE